MNKCYTGIGSRATPLRFLILFQNIASDLALAGYVLRSGHAKGADQAFEIGCDSYYGKKEIFIPWKGFESSSSEYYLVNEEATNIASSFHPGWCFLTEGAKKLHSRNVYQVLGYDLNSYSSFILCYTKEGKRQGGTGQALRIAEHFKIPIFDFGLYEKESDQEIIIRLTQFIDGVMK